MNSRSRNTPARTRAHTSRDIAQALDKIYSVRARNRRKEPPIDIRRNDKCTREHKVPMHLSIKRVAYNRALVPRAPINRRAVTLS